MTDNDDEDPMPAMLRDLPHRVRWGDLCVYRCVVSDDASQLHAILHKGGPEPSHDVEQSPASLLAQASGMYRVGLCNVEIDARRNIAKEGNTAADLALNPIGEVYEIDIECHPRENFDD